mgnify:CR=1 FL=1|jgi:hypothetical protein
MVNRVRPIIHASPEAAARMQEELDRKIEEVQKQTTDESLARSFPDWDLNPPAVLVRRRSAKP